MSDDEIDDEVYDEVLSKRIKCTNVNHDKFIMYYLWIIKR